MASAVAFGQFHFNTSANNTHLFARHREVMQALRLVARVSGQLATDSICLSSVAGLSMDSSCCLLPVRCTV